MTTQSTGKQKLLIDVPDQSNSILMSIDNSKVS